MTALPTTADFRRLAAAGKLAQNAAPCDGMPPLDGMVLEPKMDGWRILIFRDEDAVRVYSRSGKSYTGRLPRIEAEILASFPAGTWLDGEATAFTDNGDGTITDEWGTVQSVLTKHGGHLLADRVKFVVFDVLAIGGTDARALPLASRRGLLERAFTATFSTLALVEQVPATADAALAYRAAGYEGAMVKNPRSPYASGKRGHGWVKFKPQDTTDVVVMGFEEGKGGFTGLVGAIVFGQHDADGNLVQMGTCSGFDMRTRHEMTADPERFVGRVIEIAFHQPTKVGGDLRHPQWKRWRDDKRAAECVNA